MKKTLTVILALVLVVVMSVAGTVAYLTSQATVTNTFTVGKVAITLDETKVTEYGDAVPSAAPVSANQYTLIPGHTYIKDPVVHVTADSENCWVFVKVTNEIDAIEAPASATDPVYVQINQQITNNGWTALEGQPGVYYMTYTKGQTDKDLEVFQSFKVAGDADISAYAGKTIVINAYAIQSDGFGTASAAWTEVSK